MKKASEKRESLWRSMFRFMRNWALPFTMVAGVLAYWIFSLLPLSASVHVMAHNTVEVVQPSLIFAMLFLTFIRVKPSELRPHRWHIWLLLIQAGFYVLFSLAAMWASHRGVRILFEGAMLCMICPPATAAAVITGRLGGNVSGLITYILLCNLMVSVVAPMFVPLVEPHETLDFLQSFFMILGRVFPLMICPLVLSWLVRYLLPGLQAWLLQFRNLPFRLWIVSLSLAIAVTCRAIAHSTLSIWYMFGLALVACLCCVLQFYLGWRVGGCGDNRISAGQALGQKNTVFAIWMGYTFFDPFTAITGGFYSVWHNIINSWQLYRVRHK